MTKHYTIAEMSGLTFGQVGESESYTSIPQDLQDTINALSARFAAQEEAHPGANDFVTEGFNDACNLQLTLNTIHSYMTTSKEMQGEDALSKMRYLQFFFRGAATVAKAIDAEYLGEITDALARQFSIGIDQVKSQGRDADEAYQVGIDAIAATTKDFETMRRWAKDYTATVESVENGNFPPVSDDQGSDNGLEALIRALGLDPKDVRLSASDDQGSEDSDYSESDDVDDETLATEFNPEAKVAGNA